MNKYDDCDIDVNKPRGLSHRPTILRMCVTIGTNYSLAALRLLSP